MACDLPLSGELWAIIQEAHENRRLDCTFVFHRDGRRIASFRKSWVRACKAVGLEGLIVHDLRRSAARNFMNAGIDESTARKFTGHRTRSMFDRYNIRSVEDMKRASANMEEHRNKAREGHKVTQLPG